MKILVATQVVEGATTVTGIIDPIIVTTGTKIITDVKADMKVVVAAGTSKETNNITDVMNRIIVITTDIKTEIEGDSVIAVTISTN